MSVLEWKNFNLFKLQPAADYQSLKEIKYEIASQCYNDELIIFCDVNGWVHVYFNNWDCMSFQADSRSIKLCAITCDKSNILLTLTQDALTNEVCVKIFHIVAKKKCATFLGSGILGSVMSAATALQTYKIENLLCIAIGFLRGDVWLFRGIISRDISSSFKTMFVSTRSITGLSFIHTDNLTLYMFVCSDSGIYCFTIYDSNITNETKHVLESCCERTHSFDIRPNCDDDACFSVARDKAIYCFTNDGRGPCYVLDGEKPFVKWLGHNLLVVVNETVTTFNSTTTKLIVIDIKNKLIVLNKDVERIQNIIIQKSNCYLITQSMQIILLRERVIENKIRMLTKKNLFDLAMSQIEKTGFNQKSLAEVSLQYGDYFFQKGEMTKATEMYIKTIGSIEPYHIINKLLDTSSTKCLLRYLEILIQGKQLSRHHFELLKNCQQRIQLPKILELQASNDVHHQYFGLPNVNKTINQCESSSNEELNNKFFENLIQDENWQAYVGNPSQTKLLNAANMVNCFQHLQKDCPPLNLSSLLAILLTETNNYMELLDHLINAFVDIEEKLLTNLLERFLNSWKLSNEPSDQRILEFVQTYESGLNTENVIILCKLHSFWMGLTYLFEKIGHSMLSTLYLARYANFYSALENDTKWESLTTNIWLPLLKKSKLNLEQPSHSLYAMILKKPGSLLQLFQSFSCNKSVCVHHIKDCLKQERLQNVFGKNELTNHIDKLRYELLDCKMAAENYSIKGIEFRNSICDKCRQALSFPSIFFLCQHAFHKDCARFYSGRVYCVICSPAQKLNLMEERYSELQAISFCGGFRVKDFIHEISKHLANGRLNEVLADNHSLAHKAEANRILNFDAKANSNTGSNNLKDILKNSTYTPVSYINSNPFEVEETNPFENYDDNLNPFGEQ